MELITRSIEYELDGKSQLTFGKNGVTFDMSMPVDARFVLDPTKAPEATEEEALKPKPPKGHRRKR